MIPALGAGGPEFNSRSTPHFSHPTAFLQYFVASHANFTAGIYIDDSTEVVGRLFNEHDS